MTTRESNPSESGPDDPRYRAVVDKRFNTRFSARPDYVRRCSSTDQVVSAIEEGVNEGRRLVVTSGGHCLEGFVSDPEVQVIIEISPRKRVYASLWALFEIHRKQFGKIIVRGVSTAGAVAERHVDDFLAAQRRFIETLALMWIVIRQTQGVPF